MSKAFVTNMKKLRKLAKKARTPEEANLMRFFGATDLSLKYSQDSKHSISDLGMGLTPALGVTPFLPELAPLDHVFDEFAFKGVYGEFSETGQWTMLPAKGTDVVPDSTGNTVLNRQLNQGSNTGELQELLSFLDNGGLKVGEVRALPSGGIKITLDELIAIKQTKEPELVRVGD